MHDTRCEHSASDPKRCRCECAGKHHGEFASELDRQHQQNLAQIEAAGRTIQTVKEAWAKVFGGAA